MEVWGSRREENCQERAGRPWLERRAGPKLSSDQSFDRENFAQPKRPERLHPATTKKRKAVARARRVCQQRCASLDIRRTGYHLTKARFYGIISDVLFQYSIQLSLRLRTRLLSTSCLSRYDALVPRVIPEKC
ncbi:hypothetical protein L209DRAFT_468373 [Thermothelomyces heterothallicus CBS 203.75]